MGLLPTLGTIVGGIGGQLIGNAIERRHLGNIKDDDIERMQRLGLTPTEIAGAGGIGAGAGSSGAGNVLGNNAGALALQRQQQKYDMQEREKDRAVAIQGQKTALAQTHMSAQATLGSAAQSARASMYTADLQSAANMARIEMERMRLPGELQQLQNQNATSTPEFQRYMKMLSMSPQNVAAANAALGLPFDPLNADAVAAATPEQRAQVLQVLVALSSNAYREAVGATGVVFGVSDDAFEEPEQPTLGNVRPGSAGRLDRRQ